MNQHRELVLDDFEPVVLPDKTSYLSARIGEYEITLEPHMVTGFCIGIYHPKEKLALEKRAFWLRNHPALSVPPTIPSRVLERSLNYANQLVSKHIYGIQQ